MLMHLLKPNHIYYRFPKWVRKVDYCIPTHWLNPIIHPFFCWLYTRAYGNALKKWPHLRLEILSGADYHELLKKYGVHSVRTSANGYSIYYDWHPDNFKRSSGESAAVATEVEFADETSIDSLQE